MARTTLTETLLATLTVNLTSLALVAGDPTSVSTVSTGGTSPPSAMLPSDTLLYPASETGFADGDYLLVDAEIMKLTSGAHASPPGPWTVARAQIGTQATAHQASAEVLSLSVGNRVVMTNDNDLLLVFNTDTVSPHDVTIRSPYGTTTLTVAAATASGLGFAMSSLLNRSAWGMPPAVDQNALWINVSDNHLYLAVVSVKGGL